MSTITEQMIADAITKSPDQLYSVYIDHGDTASSPGIPLPVLEGICGNHNVTIDDWSSPAGFGSPPRKLNEIAIVGFSRDGVVSAAAKIIKELEDRECGVVQMGGKS